MFKFNSQEEVCFCMYKSILYLIIIALVLSLVVAAFTWSVSLAFAVILISSIWALTINRKSLNEEKKNESKDE
jgi:membrane protein implicated in regulation of membrane protease activity